MEARSLKKCCREKSDKYYMFLCVRVRAYVGTRVRWRVRMRV
jgi:hypothetical protein